MVWVKRLRDIRRLAETRAPGGFLPPPPQDFVGQAEALEMLYATPCGESAQRDAPWRAGLRQVHAGAQVCLANQGAFDAVVFQLCGPRPLAEIAAEPTAKLKLGLETNGWRHSNAKTTELYDRRGDEVSFSEIERVGIQECVYNCDSTLQSDFLHDPKGLRPENWLPQFSRLLRALDPRLKTLTAIAAHSTTSGKEQNAFVERAAVKAIASQST